MKAEYDLSKLKSRKNPYASKLKKPVTMRLSEDVVEYFKGMADEAGVPYQSLINLYLRDCLRAALKRPLDSYHFDSYFGNGYVGHGEVCRIMSLRMADHKEIGRGCRFCTTRPPDQYLPKGG